ncbi:MAG: AAC(3) family N-acetyltransferase [Ilumatobacteraceae bacterium]
MSEREVIESSSEPVTHDRIVADLRHLGVSRGDTLIVHSSLSSIGYVIGGAQTVVSSLLESIGPSGTLTMPGHSGALSEPSYWKNPPVPQAWWEIERATMPAFDPNLTPLREMGVIPETFQRLPGVKRSSHPRTSLLAFGPLADFITAGHSLADGLGEQSPLARLYERDARVLLLGVPHANNTSLHLAEYRADWPSKTRTTQGSPVFVNGRREWVTYEELETSADDFDLVGAELEANQLQTSGPVGRATTRLMSQRAVVDFAADWISRNRK